MSKNTNQTVTEIAFLLDRSGSMQEHVESAIAGFNEFLRDQQSVEGKARLTLVLFDDRCEVPIDNLPVEEVVSLDRETYTTRGTTALLDAIGITISRFRKRIRKLEVSDTPEQVIFAIFTDGLENASRHHTWQDIAEKIRKRQQKDGWEFLFLAANQDAIATAAQMNIRRDNAGTIEKATTSMARQSSRAFSRKIRAMRSREEGTEDLHAPMSDILREEEERDPEG